MKLRPGGRSRRGANAETRGRSWAARPPAAGPGGRACGRTARTPGAARERRTACRARAGRRPVEIGQREHVVVGEGRGRSGATAAPAPRAGWRELRGFLLPALQERRLDGGRVAGSAAPSRTRDVRSRAGAPRGRRSVAASAPCRSWSSAAAKNASFTSCRSPKSVVRTRPALRRAARARRRGASRWSDRRAAGRPGRRRRSVILSAGRTAAAAGDAGGGVGTSDWYCASPSTTIDGLRSAAMFASRSAVWSAWSCSGAKPRIGVDRRLLQARGGRRGLRAAACACAGARAARAMTSQTSQEVAIGFMGVAPSERTPRARVRRVSMKRSKPRRSMAEQRHEHRPRGERKDAQRHQIDDELLGRDRPHASRRARARRSAPRSTRDDPRAARPRASCRSAAEISWPRALGMMVPAR